ncbi:12-(S)-hydroxy-5,8,10,14-eicosatetraenoic acid receptor [Trichechus manatus latirostris]|uniref:12-(S)-hydroxy-5,8,10,14-eicosatetraenoic acid receptor n=1 Tax=Trichechus manatus latirostris TaxID=127582 RepID=A0A2Y9D6Z8_TRIMA|nr:12-(S)-hydroxy-5,8,10,14-eicosatetraenoic acid receptor [Trichechus manatus latirostris]XP_023584258.1 12-(S)-hydroxy-5,8,10,14-eicosatetraenoic acid receptor [Trichechus manatus latirostris]
MAPLKCSFHNDVIESLVIALLTLEFGLGLLTNVIALWTFSFRLKVWKPYSVYLFNLVIASLLLTVCLPFHITFYQRRKTWSFGDTSCQALLFLLSLSCGVGVAFLTAVALDRYFRVLHPHLKVNLLSPRWAWVISGCVWLLMVVLTHQSLLVPEAAGNSTECRSSYPREEFSFSVWQEAVFFLQFLLPFGLILLCNAGIIRMLQKRLRDPEKQPKLQRAKALITMVMVLFGLCFLPRILARILMDIFWRSESCQMRRVVEHTSDVANSLIYLNSVLNPVIYCFSNSTLRYSYRKVSNTLWGRRQEAEPRGSDRKDSYS